MKVGDLVKYKNLHGHVMGGKFVSKEWIGIIIETGSYDGGDVKVAWGDIDVVNAEKSSALQVINEGG